MSRIESVDYRPILEDVAKQEGMDVVFELKFHPVRKWRFDAAIPQIMLGIEVDGAVWRGGRHTRGSGFVKDQEKFREAAILGWKVMRFQTGDVVSGVFSRDVTRAIKILRGDMMTW